MLLTLMRLEERIVLDGAAVAGADADSDASNNGHDHSGANHAPSNVDTTHHPHADNHAGAEPADPPDRPGEIVRSVIERVITALLGLNETHDAPQRLLAVSSSVDQAAELAAATTDGVVTTLFDGGDTTLDALLQQIRDALDGQNADSIALATHGLGEGGLELVDGLSVNLETLQNPEMRAFWEGLAEMITPGGRIDLLACDAADGPRGQALIVALENLTGVNFAASVDVTGNGAQGGDWILETDHVNASVLYFDSNHLSDFTDTLDNQPTISDTNPGNTAVGGAGPTVVDPGITVDDGDGGGDTLLGASVRIKSGFVAGEDRLSFNATLANGFGITGSYDTADGELIFSGNASAAAYEQVLRSVTYENISSTPDTTPREIFFVIGDDFTGYTNGYNAQTGHYYGLVAAPVSWAISNTNADGSTLGGLRGYLATVASLAESNLIGNLISPFPLNQRAWLGASDATTEGGWLWVTGPENGTQFWQGDFAGGTVGGMFANWDAGEPNDTGNSDYLTILRSGMWRDEPGAAGQDGYIVEYGGLAGDVEGPLAAGVTINVATPNHAPLLDNTGVMSLTAINEDHTSNGGNTVADVIASAGGDRITDYNAGALEGIAIIGIDNARGTWQYSTDGGASWHSIGSVTNANALLLRDSDLIRFQPDANWNGTVDSGMTFRAWDRTAGSAGSYVDVTTNGGTTAFSTATEAASLVVNSVNDAPDLDSSGDMSLTAISEDDFDNAGDTVASIIASAGGDRITDLDGGALEGIALIGIDSAHGLWQYSTDGGLTWHDIGSVDVDHALLLRNTDLIRFLPDADWNGSIGNGLTFRAWDQTDGSAGDFADTTVNGGATAFSNSIETAALVVNAVNDEPTVAVPLVDQAGREASVFRYQFASDTFADVDVGDTLTYSATLADGSPLPGWLVFDADTRTFLGTPTAANVGMLIVRVTADDGHGGMVTDTFVITISAAGNTPPPEPPPPAPRNNSGSNPPPDGSSDTLTPPSDTALGDGGTMAGIGDLAEGPGAEEASDASSGPTTFATSESGGETASAADGASPAVAGVSDAAGNRDRSDVHHREEEEEEELEIEADQLTLQVRNAMFDGELLSDENQPAEFREAWNTILAAYADSGEELAAYLQSAFRTVTESACIYQSAEQTLTALHHELALAGQSGYQVNVETLLSEATAARDNVKLAGSQLEAAILTAAEAGRDDTFDQALEDVISAALQRLMTANESLFVESQALSAVVTVLRDARVNGESEVGQDQIDVTAAWARLDAHTEITEMRASWDRVARDVFSAFVARLVAQQAGQSESTDSE